MAQYLVLYRGHMDDLPVKLFDNRKEAVRLAKELAVHYEEDAGDGFVGLHHEAVMTLEDVLGIDVGTYCGISLLTLKNGVPYKVEHLEAQNVK